MGGNRARIQTDGTENLFSENYSRKLLNPEKERASTNKSNLEPQITTKTTKL